MLNFIKSGALIPLLLMLPNFVWMALPKPEAAPHTNEPLWLTIVENIGRIAILLIPVFYKLDLRKPCAVLVLVVMGLALAVYYTCWWRYFAGGAAPELMSAPIFSIPLPMAAMPVLFLLLSAYLLASWPMLVASLVFGVAHIWVSALTL